ncbi:MAG: ATP-binding protein, partial [Planctomycetota bacterium]
VYVRPVRHLITALCAMAHYDEDETHAIELVATEILNNSIEHGARDRRDTICVTIVVRRDLFRIEVVDPGRGGESFARRAVQRAGERPGVQDLRGRGLFLIRSMMDDMQVTYDEGHGTKVTASKARAP